MKLWYQRAVRRLLLTVVAVALGAGCGVTTPSEPAPTAQQSASPAVDRVNPARVKRIGAEIPDGYEIADAPGVASPATFWGIRPGWTADPAPCAALVHPADDPAAQGLSGSGTGGLLYVVAVVDHGGVPEPALVAECGHWMLTAGQTVATVTAQPGPAIDGVATFGMSTAIRVVVESGTETDSVAHTFTAYPDGYLVFVTLITDPGSPDPPLPPQFAAELLVKTVAAVRG